MTRPSLAGIEQRSAEATEGPWSAGRGCVVAPVDAPNAAYSDAANVRYYGGALIGESIARAEDRAFIADARTAVPALTAAVRDVLALHAPAPVYAYIDDCGHPDDGDHGIEVMCGEYVCPDTPTGDVLCLGCGLDEDQDPTPYPCETVRALAAHLDLTDPE